MLTPSAPTDRPPGVSRGRRSLWTARAVLVVVVVLGPLVLLEAALRALGPILPGNYATGTFLTSHPIYARFHVPGFDGWVKTPEFTARVTINTRGLRGPERDYPKPAGVRRVLVLGDSFVEAAQVAERDAMVGRLEAALNQRRPGAFEVLNGGVGGWGTGQQYLFLQHKGQGYAPDLVIVVLYLGNDVFDNSWALQGRPANPREPYFVFAEDGSFGPMAFRPRKADDGEPLTDALRRHTMLWNVFETGVLQKVAESGEDADLRADRPNLNKVIIHATRSSARQDEAWLTTLTLLRRIAEFNAERAVPTVVVAAPAAYQVDDDAWEELRRKTGLRGDEWSPTWPNQVLAANGPKIGAPLLDLLPAMQAASTGGEALYFSRDRHWTPAGHAVAATAIEAFLVERGLLP